MEYELYHHGILGQKWGKRNGPPYPLKPEDHSKAEKEAKKKFYLTDEQKKYIKIGAAVVSAGLVTYGAYKVGLLNPLVNKGKNVFLNSKTRATLKDFLSFNSNDLSEIPSVKEERDKWDNFCKNSEFKSLNDIPKLDPSQYFDSEGNLYPDRLLTGINPSWPDVSGKDNCILTVISSVMRLKGYDVSSALLENSGVDGWSPSIITYIFNNAKVYASEKSTWDKLNNELLSQGKGAYGLLKTGTGPSSHGILYFVNSNGVGYYDTQVNLVYKTEELIKRIHFDDVIYSRLDNFEPNDKVVGAITKSYKGETVIPFMVRSGAKV